MDTLSKVLLGVVAIATVVQALVVLALALAGRRLALDLAEVRDRLGGQLEPVAGDVRRVVRNAAEASETLVAQKRAVGVYRSLSPSSPYSTKKPGGPHGIWAERHSGVAEH